MTPVILPASLQEAQRPIAGLAAISRLLIELGRAGARRVIVAVEPRLSLIARADEELARAGQSIKIAWIAPDRLADAVTDSADEDLVVFGCKALVRARAIVAFAERPGFEALRAGGCTLAVRIRPDELTPGALERAGAKAVRVMQAPSPEVVRLDQPRRAALAILKDAGKASDGWTSRWLNRPVSRRISALLLQIGGLRPGHLTVFTALVALSMFLTLAFGGRIGLVLGCLMFHVASVVDGLDGEVARATYRSSAKGALMDTVVDVATNLLFGLGLSLGLLRSHDGRDALAGAYAVALWGAGVLLLSLMVRLGPRGGSLDVLKIAYARRLTGPVLSRLVAIARNVLGRDFFALAFAVIGLFGAYGAIPWLATGAAGFWLVLIAAAAPMVLRSRPGVLQPDHLAPALEAQAAVELVGRGAERLAYKASPSSNRML